MEPAEPGLGAGTAEAGQGAVKPCRTPELFSFALESKHFKGGSMWGII